MQLIETKTLGANAALIEFTSIPQTFTDLVFLVSLRLSSTSTSTGQLVFNGSATAHTRRRLEGNGSTATSSTGGVDFTGSRSTYTAATFGSNEIYIPNYTGSTHKSYSTSGVNENDATEAIQIFVAGIWPETAAITSVRFNPNNGDFVTGSTISLYGILKGSDGITTAT